MSLPDPLELLGRLAVRDADDVLLDDRPLVEVLRRVVAVAPISLTPRSRARA